MNSVVIKVVNENGKFMAYDANGKDWTSEVGYGGRKRAFEQGMALEQRVKIIGGKFLWLSLIVKKII